MSEIEPIKVPKWGLSMEEGTIVNWHVAVGDRVAEGDELVDIETTKITNVCEAHTDGLVRRIIAEEGATLPVGALIAVMADEGVEDGAIETFVAEYEANFDPAEAAAESAREIKNVDIGAGRTLRVGVAGEGRDGAPVVLVHGFGGDLDNWSLVQAQLAEARPVFAVELPGHGQSTKDVGEGRLADLTTAVVAAIDALSLGEVVLVGHSLGGAVALSAALALGDRAKALGLVCPAAAPGGVLSADYLDAFVAARRARDLKAPMEKLFKDPSLATLEMREELIRAKRLDGAPEALTLIKDNLKGGDPAYADLYGRLADAPSALALIASREDQIVGPPDVAAFPDRTTVTWVEDAGHMPHAEKSDVVAEALQALIARA